MIRVVFFDLDRALAGDRPTPRPPVDDALRTVRQFVTTDGKPLQSAKVVEKQPASGDSTSLTSLLESALEQLEIKVTLEECLLATANADRASVARDELRMLAVLVRAADAGVDEGWLQVPPQVARLVGSRDGSNDELALRSYLSVACAFDADAIDRPRSDRVAVRGMLWTPLGPSAGADIADVHVPFLVGGEVIRGSAGEVQSVRFDEPKPDDVREAASFVRSLAHHGQMASRAGERSGTATHTIETDARGRRRLVRTGFHTARDL